MTAAAMAEPKTPASPTQPMTSRAVIGRVARTYLTPRWKGLAASLLCAVAFAALSGLLLKILQPAVNDMIATPKPGALARLPLMIVGLALARGAVQLAQATLVNKIGNGVVGDLQLGLFKTLMRADLARLLASHSGGFVSQVLFDAGLTREAATSGLVNLIRESLTIAAAGAVMATTDWKLGLFVLLAGPVVGAILRRFARRTRAATTGAMRATSDLSTAIMESLDGIRVVKIENREAYEEGRVAAVIAQRQAHLISGDNARAAAAPVSETVTMVVVAAVLTYEGWLASHGHVDIGGFAAFFAALLTAAQSLRQVANLSTVMSQGVTAAGRLFATLDVAPEIGDAAGRATLPIGEARVALEGVSFSYGAGEPVLDDVSLSVARGEIVALVGPSGAGKSTVLNLIPRFYDAGGGRVSIDGHDVRAVAIASLRSQIALVTQEPFLFDDTIGANIAYSKAGATQDQIEAAARAAAAHEFITALPKGYDTLVGEAGARLSGGQRQRIAIARAFLKDAPILLLDEATSALDTESEALVQTALTRLMAGRTTLIIAHRLSTVRGADRIYVLEGGKVVETGTHGALMALGGLYARLAGSQDLEQVAAEGAG
jgi:subfamily B ATP-binding cassette protein MsbA